MGHLVDWRRTRQRPGDSPRAPLPALARAVVFRLHLFRRFPGELRRIQGDGARAVRRAEVRRPDQAAPRRDSRRWQPVDEPGVLHLRARPDHDRHETRDADGRTGAQARIAPDAARDGPRAVDPGDHRGGDAEDDRVRAPGNRHARPLSRRRRRAQLCRERPHPARGAVRAGVDSAGGGRCRWRARRRDEPVAPPPGPAARECGITGHVAALFDVAQDRSDTEIRRRHERLVPGTAGSARPRLPGRSARADGSPRASSPTRWPTSSANISPPSGSSA